MYLQAWLSNLALEVKNINMIKGLFTETEGI